MFRLPNNFQFSLTLLEFDGVIMFTTEPLMPEQEKPNKKMRNSAVHMLLNPISRISD